MLLVASDRRETSIQDGRKLSRSSHGVRVYAPFKVCPVKATTGVAVASNPNFASGLMPLCRLAPALAAGIGPVLVLEARGLSFKLFRPFQEALPIDVLGDGGAITARRAASSRFCRASAEWSMLGPRGSARPGDWALPLVLEARASARIAVPPAPLHDNGLDGADVPGHSGVAIPDAETTDLCPRWQPRRAGG
jgi:hypothetical protein